MLPCESQGLFILIAADVPVKQVDRISVALVLTFVLPEYSGLNMRSVNAKEK